MQTCRVGEPTRSWNEQRPLRSNRRRGRVTRTLERRRDAVATCREHQPAVTVDHGTIVSIYEPENTASGAVMKRLGFSLDRTTTDPERGIELHVMSLTRDRWADARNRTM
jgi:hypothetical protein